MMDERSKKLVEYFKRNLSKGYSSETLKFALIKQGYSQSIVLRAIEIAHKELSKKAPEIKR